MIRILHAADLHLDSPFQALGGGRAVQRRSEQRQLLETIAAMAEEKADVLLAYGPNASRVVSGALTGGMNHSAAKDFEDRNEMIAAMKRTIRPGDTILVKGSRGMRMELILDGFLEET